MRWIVIGLAVVVAVAGSTAAIYTLFGRDHTSEAKRAKMAARSLAVRESGDQQGRMRVQRLTRVAPSIWIADIIDSTPTTSPMVDESCARIDLRRFQIRPSPLGVRGVTYLDALRDPRATKHCSAKSRV